MHRACGNWFLIQRIMQGEKIWTEHEIQQGLAPVHSVLGKIPDALIESEHGLTWVEVDNSWKNVAERKKVLTLCQAVIPHHYSIPMFELSPEHFLFRVAIVSNTASALRSMVGTFVKAFEMGELNELQASAVELHLHVLNPSLIPTQVAQGNLWLERVMHFEKFSFATSTYTRFCKNGNREILQ